MLLLNLLLFFLSKSAFWFLSHINKLSTFLHNTQFRSPIFGCFSRRHESVLSPVLSFFFSNILQTKVCLKFPSPPSKFLLSWTSTYQSSCLTLTPNTQPPTATGKGGGGVTCPGYEGWNACAKRRCWRKAGGGWWGLISLVGGERESERGMNAGRREWRGDSSVATVRLGRGGKKRRRRADG